MPNRILKESIKTSPEIDQLSWFEEVVFNRLIVTVDDYGCYDGRVIVLKNELFPTKDCITRKNVEDAIVKLESVKLLVRYEVDGKPYIYLTTFGKHQRLRNKNRKYPEPPSTVICPSNVSQVTADCPNELELELEEELEDNMSDLFRRIIDYLNQKTGKHYRIGDATKKKIKARLKAGFTEQDFYTVIDIKCSKWLNDEKMNDYLRPETLFGNKFESYLNEKPKRTIEDKLPVYDTSVNKELDPEEEADIMRLMGGKQWEIYKEEHGIKEET